jgi:hypothetical protein
MRFIAVTPRQPVFQLLRNSEARRLLTLTAQERLRINYRRTNMAQTRHLAASLAGAALFLAWAQPASAQEGMPPATPGGWAVVNADGSLGAHMNVKNVTRVSKGVYHVDFNQRVGRCAATSTIGGSAKSIVPGFIVVQRHRERVTVHTFAAVTLLPADFKFNLHLACPG